jgi:RecB family exonuclease
MYQLAVAAGLLGAGPDSVEPGGARLVYLGKTGASGVAEREQDPLTTSAGEQWREVIGRAADATAGPQFIARRNDGCSHCPIRPYCPAHVDGPQR